MSWNRQLTTGAPFPLSTLLFGRKRFTQLVYSLKVSLLTSSSFSVLSATCALNTFTPWLVITRSKGPKERFLDHDLPRTWQQNNENSKFPPPAPKCDKIFSHERNADFEVMWSCSFVSLVMSCVSFASRPRGREKPLHAFCMPWVCFRNNDDYDRPQISLIVFRICWTEITEKSISVVIFTDTGFLPKLLLVR